MELVEKGSLSSEDLGLDLQFGGADVLVKGLELVSTKEGYANRLGGGGKALAEDFGSPELFMGVKGAPLASFDPRAIQGLGLHFATCNQGPHHAYGYTFIDELMNVRFVGNVPSHNDGGAGRVLSNDLAHLLGFAHIRDDRADTDDVVIAVSHLIDEAIQGGEVQEGAGRVDVGLNNHEAERPVEHPQGRSALNPRHLVVVELHRVDDAASVFIVLRIGAEDAGK